MAAAEPERADSTSGPEKIEAEDDKKQQDTGMEKPKFYSAKTLIVPGKKRVEELDIDKLPAPLKRRIRRLKQLQLKTMRIDADFHEERHALESRYYQLLATHYQRRSDIISGAYEPTDEECVWESDDKEEVKDKKQKNDDKKSGAQITEVKEEENKSSPKLKSILKVTETKEEEESSEEEEEDDLVVVDFKGIPGFWLKTFHGCPYLEEAIKEHDEPILAYLYDVKVKYLESNPMGFVLEFYFSPNEYFSNKVLTKEYHMRSTIKKDDLSDYEGPQIYRCKGCIIDWKRGQNATVKTIKKKVRHKDGTRERIPKVVKRDSFFNYFSPPIVPNESAPIDDETEIALVMDFEMAHYIKEKLVPKAVLYFTGEDVDDEYGEPGYEDQDEDEKD